MNFGNGQHNNLETAYLSQRCYMTAVFESKNVFTILRVNIENIVFAANDGSDMTESSKKEIRQYSSSNNNFKAGQDSEKPKPSLCSESRQRNDITVKIRNNYHV